MTASQPAINMKIWIAKRKTAFHFIEMITKMMMFYMLKQSFQFKQAINFDTRKRIRSKAYNTTRFLIQHL